MGERRNKVYIPAGDILQVKYLFQSILGLDNFAQNSVNHTQLKFFYWIPLIRHLETSEILEIKYIVFTINVHVHLSKKNPQICQIFKVVHKIHFPKD